MIQINRFLALIPAVALTAACSGVTPTGSSATNPNDSYAAAGDATAMAVPPGDSGQGCKQITEVLLRILPVGMSNEVAFQAKYRYEGPASLGCSIAPVWTASRRGLRVHPTDPFRAAIDRKTNVRTTVTATAPNGVFAKIIF